MVWSLCSAADQGPLRLPTSDMRKLLPPRAEEGAAACKNSMCCYGRYMGSDGEMVRPWCPATRLLDQREMDALNTKAEAAKRAGMTDSRFAEKAVPLREGFPALEVRLSC